MAKRAVAALRTSQLELRRGLGELRRQVIEATSGAAHAAAVDGSALLAEICRQSAHADGATAERRAATTALLEAQAELERERDAAGLARQLAADRDAELTAKLGEAAAALGERSDPPPSGPDPSPPGLAHYFWT